MQLVISEILLIRSALNCLWNKYVKKHCPKEVGEDLNKYHQWCLVQEKDRMTDLYWIQSIRKKLNDAEKKILQENINR